MDLDDFRTAVAVAEEEQDFQWDERKSIISFSEKTRRGIELTVERCPS
jgi:hypothetical protein